ncbi:DUF4625 domain-containing protein [Bacteroides sp. UBA939]|uniref:DUF4625 domain-containing protein n=1 Tax=Bacteroides sp. UBA939 TaxID=1946092 RepID=UPI0025C0E7D0|nr:DUF4625 domain-containing protein [Bacteroides sp. UBA939]
MKTKYYFPIISLVMFSWLFTSCDDKNRDTTPPVIDVQSPSDEEVILIGDEHGIHLEMDLSDDIMLLSYKIQVHSNFDGHGHDHDHDTRSGEETVPFHFEQSYNVTDRTAHIEHDIEIPANATPGDYHLMVFCTDEAKNDSEVVRSIVLSTGDEDHDHDHDE